MSGHSKWATTKHKKAVIDARRGKNFARLIKNVEVAARVGGGDPGGNPTLYDAIQKAKKNSVPNDNIERARKRGAGEEAGGADYQSITYEGYGPNGVAVLIECLTDNRNRAAGEVRVAVTRNGGNMADPGSVSYLFSRKGLVTLAKDGLTEDDVLTAVLDAGAEEVNDLDDGFEIICEPGDLVGVRTALQDAGIDYESAEASFQPGDGACGPRRRSQGGQADLRAGGSRRCPGRLHQRRHPRRRSHRPRRGVTHARMSTAEVVRNKETFRRLEDAVNTCDAEFISKSIDELVEPDATVRTPLPSDATGAQLLKQVWAVLLLAFPDLHLNVEDLIGEDDKVVARIVVTGTHLGDYMGLEPTGKSIAYDEIFIFRFANGRVVETWGVVDVLSQMRQLGAIPD